MKIVYLSYSMIPSHAANSIHVMKMCQAFVKNGHETILIAPDQKTKYEKEVEDIFAYYGVDKCFTIRKLPFIHPRGNSYLYILSTIIYCWYIFLQLRRLKPDLVYGRYLCGCYVAVKLGIPTIFESHAPIWTSRLEGSIFMRIVKNRNFVQLIVISNALKKRYLSSGLLHKEKIQVAHDGADVVPDFEPMPDWPGREDRLQVGYVGSLYSGRGIRIILELACMLQDVDFHVVGGTEQEIQSFTEDYDLPNLYFHGYINPRKVYKYRNSCDILLAAYEKKVAVWGGGGDTSGFMSPLKIFEYMASKKPIIASDLPALREVLNDKVAIMVEPDDIEGWKASILVLQNEALRRKLGQEAHRKFSQHYTWDIRARSVLSGYNLEASKGNKDESQK